MAEFDIRGMRHRPHWPAEQPAQPTNAPAPKRSSPLDHFTVPEVLAILNLWSAYRRGDLNEGER